MMQLSNRFNPGYSPLSDDLSFRDIDRQLGVWTLSILLAVTPCYGLERPLLELSIEELGNIKVTSVTKKIQRLASAAASIYVITADSIRRAGARSIPEALRLAPNLQVAQINAFQYAISARGFNSSTANKLLVLIDGRAVYTPLFSGVFWDAQEVLLKDIDRIEVISGSGGALWGANAVNGVINIITKATKATTGELVYASAGNTGQTVALRHGGELELAQGYYRVYAKLARWEHSVRADDTAVPDAWDRTQFGFRTDWGDWRSNFTLQGDTYWNSIDQLDPGQQSNSGVNVLARWNRTLTDGSELKLQTYLDHTSRDTPGTYREQLNILDLELQHSLAAQSDQQLIWGVGYRIADDRVDNSAALAFLPAERTLQWTNFFIQQERELWPDWLLTLGAKLERNNYTGFEFMPKLKLAWQMSDDKLLWLGLNRSIRSPARIDLDFYVPGTPPYLLAGGPGFRSEVANTLELGWRAQPGQRLSYSLVGFHSQYDHLRSLKLQPTGEFTLSNQIEGHVDGLEALVSYQATDSWTLEVSGLMLDAHFSGPNLALAPPGNDVDWQWGLNSKWNLSTDQFLDISWRRVSQLPAPPVPAYTLLNIHYGWQITDAIELGLTGRNLLDRYHQEFAEGSGATTSPIQIERGLHVSFTVRF